MTVENSHNDNRYESHTKKEWRFIKLASRAKEAARRHLESFPEQLNGEKSIMVKVPHSRRVFHITDINDMNPTKKDAENGELVVPEPVVRITAFRKHKHLDLDYWITFPLQAKPNLINNNTSLYSSSTPFGVHKMRELARNLERAV